MSDPNDKQEGMNDPKLNEIWKQAQVPVIFRRDEGDLMVKMPYHDDNRRWLHKGRRSQPTYDGQYKCWLLPRSCFSELSQRFLNRFGEVYVIQPHNEKEVCAPACWSAHGLECECSCLGKNHGSGQPDGRWYILSETCAVRWGEKHYRWSLLKRPEENRG